MVSGKNWRHQLVDKKSAFENIVYVGLGGAGGQVLIYDPDFFKDKKILYLDSPPEMRYGYDELSALNRTIYDEQEITNYFCKKNYYVIILGIAGQIGSKNIFKILDYLIINNIKYTCFCFLPFKYESKPGVDISNRIAPKLLNYKNVRLLDLDDIVEKNPSLTIASKFWIPNRILIEEYLRYNSFLKVSK